MSAKPDIDALIDAMAPVLGLTIEPEMRADVAAHLSVALAHGAALLAFTLPDEAEPAPVFTP